MNTRHFLGRSARTAAVLVVGLMSTFGAVSAASTADAARMTTGPGPGRKACSRELPSARAEAPTVTSDSAGPDAGSPFVPV